MRWATSFQVQLVEYTSTRLVVNFQIKGNIKYRTTILGFNYEVIFTVNFGL